MVFCCSSVCFHSKVENSMMRQRDIVFFSPFNLLYVIESVHSFNEYFSGTYWSRSWRYISEQSRQEIHALQSLYSNKGRLQTEKFSCYRRLKDERKELLKGRLTNLGSKSPTMGFLRLTWVYHSLAQTCLTFLILSCSPTRTPPSYHTSPSSPSLQQALSYLKIEHPYPCSGLGGSHSQHLPEASLWHFRLWCILKLSLQPRVFLAHLLLPPDPFHISQRHTALGVKSLLLILICKFTSSMGRISSRVSKVKQYLTWQKDVLGCWGRENVHSWGV